MSEPTRLWRLRKDNTWIDARIYQDNGSDTVELRFYYDGTMVYARKWPSKETALAEADDQRRDFERAGWTPHW